MKILYAIQGTGNGHVARAQDIIPQLQLHGAVDVFVSGAQTDISLLYPVKYTSKGLSFYFGKSGGINFIKTIRKNNAAEIAEEIETFPVEKYDLIVNDFEPISAWAAKKKGVPIVGLSHQAAFLSPKCPRPKLTDPFGEWIFKNYAPVKKYVGFHFQEYDQNIFTPVIRSVVREAKPADKGHYTVYLPAYDDEKLVRLLSSFRKVKWHVFSKHCTLPYHVGSLSVYPVSNHAFVESMINATGVLCGAGFETPAEALYLKKKLLVVPMKNQYEQTCNGIALKKMGIARIKRLKRSSLDKVADWLETQQTPEINFQNTTAQAVANAVGLG